MPGSKPGAPPNAVHPDARQPLAVNSRLMQALTVYELPFDSAWYNRMYQEEQR